MGGGFCSWALSWWKWIQKCPSNLGGNFHISYVKNCLSRAFFQQREEKGHRKGAKDSCFDKLKISLRIMAAAGLGVMKYLTDAHHREVKVDAVL